MLIPEWQFVSSMADAGEHSVLYADDSLGVVMEVVTLRNRASAKFGKQRARYAIRGVNKVFLTEDALVDELERRAGGSIAMADCCPNCGYDIISSAPFAFYTPAAGEGGDRE